MKKTMTQIRKFAKFMGAQYLIHVTGITAVLATDPLSYTNQVNTTVGASNLMTFITQTLNLAISLSALIAVGYLVYSGIQYIVAAGDENKVEKATKGITYAVIGLVIAFISVIIINYVIEDVIQA